MYNLNENVSPGGNRRATNDIRYGNDRTTYPGTTAKFIAGQRAAREALDAAANEPPKPKKTRTRTPSRGIPATEHTLRGTGKTSLGLSQARLKKLKDRASDLSLPTEVIIRIHKRIAAIEAARKRRKLWGTPEARAEEVMYVLDYLITEGYVDSYESAAIIAETMSDMWLNSILME